MKKKLFVVRGVPGSGKSTFAKELNADYHFEADMYFINPETGEYIFSPVELKNAHQWCRSSVEQHMIHLSKRETCSIVVSNTFTQEWEMQPYFELAEKYGYDVFSIIVENRHGGKNVHDCPEEKVQIMRDRFEVQL
jgi:predicted kinase